MLCRTVEKNSLQIPRLFDFYASSIKFLHTLFQSSAMSVIGFDIGNESCVIAAAKRGGVDVLLNDESKRETSAVVSFGDKQRFLGSAGAAFATANPKSTVSQIKRLIGKLYKDVEDDLKQLPFVTSEGPRGGVLIELEYLKQKFKFTPVEILAMLLKHLKQITEKNLETAVVDCVIGIPSYFTDLQRRMYLDAAWIAGLKPLRLMHDGTAIALGYGMYKTDFDSSELAIVVFVDIGHCDTQVTVAAFEQGGMKILSHSFDENLGGRDFDEVLFKHFAAQFEQKYKIDVCSNVRASVRLRASCEKVKKVLSANSEAPISIECLIGDTDVRGFITRDEFEKLSSKLLERVIVPCKMALKDSGLSIDEIYTIELVGSGSRVPAITRVLTSFFGKEPTRTLNASECVARGCALRCAMLSPTLIVREYKIKDAFPYSIVIPTPQGEVMVFPKGSPFPEEKMMRHTGNTLFDLLVAYINETNSPAGISHIVGHFVIGPSESSDAENVMVEFGVKLNGNGIVDLDFATILEDKSYSGSTLINPWKMMTASSHMLNLPVSENIDVSTTNDELAKAKEKEKMLTEQGIKVEETKDQRNTLESFVYDTRSKLSGAYQKFATDSEKEVLTKNLQETEDWLYEDSDDESEQDYTGKLKDLKKLLKPIEKRYKEENALAKATKALQSCIAKYRSRADSLSADKKEEVNSVCINAEQWLSDLSQKHLSPKTLSTCINHAIHTIESDCESIIRTKPSSSQHEEHVHSENVRENAAKPLQDCLVKYYSLAESLPAEKREEVQDVCRKAEKWLKNAVSKKHLSAKTLSTDINRIIEIVERDCKRIIKSKSSSPRHGKPVDSDPRDQTVNSDQKDQPLGSENAVIEATKALQIRIAKYCLHAESLPADIQEEVNSVCMEAERRVNAVIQKQSSPITLTSYINQVIKDVERACENIIRSESSHPRHGKPVDSDQGDQTVKSDQKDRCMDSENAAIEATKALQTLIASYRLHAESLPDDMKVEVNDACTKAEWRSYVTIEKQLSPNTLTTYINQAIEDVESDCERIISSKSSSSRRGKHLDSDPRDQTVNWDQKAQPMDPEKAVKEATKALQACFAKYCSHAESLSADMKEEINYVCIEAERQVNAFQKLYPPNTLTTYINRVIEGVERKCNSIIMSKLTSPRHGKPGDSDPSDQSVKSDQKDPPVDSKNSVTEATKALQTRIAKYRSHSELLPADMKEKVNRFCIEVEQQLAVSQKHLCSNTLTAYIKHTIERVDRTCEGIVRSKPSSPRHEEPVGSDQRDQPMDMDQVDETVYSDQRDQPMDTDQRFPHNDRC
ncbi:hypothetical protein QVD17_17889 [Tagetes erecta]|uniref:Uncharacterized protein n=1 Tax=Tagetes erecta TaxID=13708 RepID=A0AAD8KH49_TARER|nr:hypothetical protein QVD17_17889 [Tagetes erecta]